MRRAVPWFDLAFGVLAPGAGLLLLAIGVDETGPLSFMGWRSLLVAIPGILLARPTMIAWRDAIPASLALMFGLGMLGYALDGGDLVTVGVVTVTVALTLAPMILAASCLTLPGLPETMGALGGLGTLVVLASTTGMGPDAWLAAASGVGFAAAVVLSERVIHDHPAPTVVMPALGMAGLILLGAGVVLGEAWLPTKDVVPALVVTGLVTGLLAMLARWRGVEVLGVKLARPTMGLEMLGVVAVAVWFGSGWPSTELWVALVVGLLASAAPAWGTNRLSETELFSAGR